MEREKYKETIRFAFDVTEIRHGEVGGIEFGTQYILNGFQKLHKPYEMYLLVTKKNRIIFDAYSNDERINIVECYEDSSSLIERIKWINIGIKKFLKENDIHIFYSYTYYRPFYKISNVIFINTIHDLMIKHYPHYLSKSKKNWQHFMWKNVVKNSNVIVTISDYCKNDLSESFPRYKDKYIRIYNAIPDKTLDISNNNELLEKYGVKKDCYYYSISQLYPHKNYQTIIEVIKYLRDNKIELPHTLLLTAGKNYCYEEIEKKIHEYSLEEHIRFTGYVSEEEKDTLIRNCKAFLFPSVFEGFGNGPIEAMILGTPVITTKESCIYEVTQGKANYVSDPYSISEWVYAIKNATVHEGFDKTVYDEYIIAENIYKVIISKSIF